MAPAVVLFSRGFLTTDSFLSILRQTAMVSLMAMGMGMGMGMTFALSAGEIDLSASRTR